jgi:hypothetical protein
MPGTRPGMTSLWEQRIIQVRPSLLHDWPYAIALPRKRGRECTADVAPIEPHLITRYHAAALISVGGCGLRSNRARSSPAAAGRPAKRRSASAILARQAAPVMITSTIT